MLAVAETLPNVTDESERAARQSELITAARNSARLTDQLLSLERLRYDARLQVSRVDLSDITQEVCLGLAPTILSRNLDFAFEPGPEALPVDVDKVLVGEALTNLVENALRHGGSEMTRITVRTNLLGEEAAIEVQDDGEGIPLEQAEAAFRRFSQLHSGEGTGLGLAIVEQVMQRHTGTVRLCPVYKGTLIRLTFPLASFER